MMNPLEMQTAIKIGNETHVLSYPSVGEKMNIESMKMLLTGGMYGEYARSNHLTAQRLLDVVDAFSYFSVLIPALKLKVDSFKELTPQLELVFLKAFKEQFVPWYDKIEKQMLEMLNAIEEEAPKDNGKEE